MTDATYKPAVIKQYARLVLALFVLSVLNVVMQTPAHAGMQMQMDHPTVFQSADCYCPPVVCDSVLALDNQSLDGVSTLPADDSALYNLIEVLDQNSGQLNQSQHIEKILLNASQAAPPALLINTLLLI
ncbi:hypothetical protein MNBD_GAMMA07-955 [hydrothermal vent metagenome]|uniref:Uncharacterized protein n=1 Tax=hydrothermal vent metagenome TaxID=652676 RepID=A0A3B0WHF6_9ZZZZ